MIRTTHQASLIDTYVREGKEIWVINRTAATVILPFFGPRKERLTVALEATTDPLNLSERLDRETIQGAPELRRLINLRHIELVDPDSLAEEETEEDYEFDVEGDEAESEE